MKWYIVMYIEVLNLKLFYLCAGLDVFVCLFGWFLILSNTMRDFDFPCRFFFILFSNHQNSDIFPIPPVIPREDRCEFGLPKHPKTLSQEV